MPSLYVSPNSSANRYAKNLYLGAKIASSLVYAGVEFDGHLVDICRPQRYANLAVIEKFSSTDAVPELVDEQEIIFDSLAVMEYANDHCGGAFLPIDIQR